MKLFQKYAFAFAMSLSALSIYAEESNLLSHPHIREYTSSDRDAVSKILEEAQILSIEHIDDIAEHAYDGTYWQLTGFKVIVHESPTNAVVGVCIYSFDHPDLKADHYAYVIELAVLNAFQKKGIGKALMNYCINDCKAHECEIIELTSAPKTDAYYENMGFVWNGTTSRAGLKIYLKDLHTN